MDRRQIAEDFSCLLRCNFRKCVRTYMAGNCTGAGRKRTREMVARHFEIVSKSHESQFRQKTSNDLLCVEKT